MKRRLRNWLGAERRGNSGAGQADGSRGDPRVSPDLNDEKQAQAEWDRLQSVIDDRKQVAQDTEISYHLWALYRSHFRPATGPAAGPRSASGEWYDIDILDSGAANGVSRCRFRLRDQTYTFEDDEEKQGWRENLKVFSLFLYDEAGNCLIEIPMKMRVDSEGRSYSIASDGPKAFLPGGWINDFINVRLKNLSIRNQEIRAQKHAERLREIEDLKNRFGLRD